MEEAWDRLPEPKGVYDVSFHIVLYITEIYLLFREPRQAREWSERIFDYDPERIDSGQRDFLAGKVAYDLGKLEKAKRVSGLPMKNRKAAVF